MKKYKIFKSFIYILLLTIICGCAYFNTFYNANLFFDEAEQIRTTQEKEIVSNTVREKYKKVIAKCEIVINKYSKSTFVDDAYFLKGKSHYYIGEYDQAESSFSILSNINHGDYDLISEYWLALIKWKKGKPQPALNDLNQIISKTDDKKILALVYKSQADINLDLNQDVLALSALEKAAKITEDRSEKGKIYFKLGELADKIGNYERAIENYENVINYSYSSNQILESQLRIVQRYRDLGKYKRASDQIKNMLNKPDFESIYAELNLEIAKLDILQNYKQSAIEKLNDIVVNFPKTKVSAEAFYLLGDDFLLRQRNFNKSEYYFEQIKKEFNQSKFQPEAEKRLKEIRQYNESKKYLNSVLNINTKIDSSQDKLDTTKIAEELYNLGELEAFHFNQIDTSLKYFNDIIFKYPGSILEDKTLYTLSIINQKLGNTAKSISYEKQIIAEFPNSEYAEYLRSTNKSLDYGVSNFQKLNEAEKLYLINKELALDKYRNIIKEKESEAVVRALLFLANEYENKYFNVDSVKKYYTLIIDKFPDSEQSKIAKQRINILKINDTDNN